MAWTPASYFIHLINNSRQYELTDSLQVKDMNSLIKHLLMLRARESSLLAPEIVSLEGSILKITDHNGIFSQVYKLYSSDTTQPVGIFKKSGSEYTTDLSNLFYDVPGGTSIDVYAVSSGKGMKDSERSEGAKYVPSPVKGDLITLDNNTYNVYRVLKIENGYVKLMRMPTLPNDGHMPAVRYNRSELAQIYGGFSGALYYLNANTYSNLHGYCYGRTSFISTEKMHTEYPTMWSFDTTQPSESSRTFKFQYHGFSSSPSVRWATYVTSSSVELPAVRSVQLADLVDYFGEYMTSEQCNEFFFNTKNPVDYNVWLADSSTKSNRAWFVNGSFGNLSTFEQTGLCRPAPVFYVKFQDLIWHRYTK